MSRVILFLFCLQMTVSIDNCHLSESNSLAVRSSLNHTEPADSDTSDTSKKTQKELTPKERRLQQIREFQHRVIANQISKLEGKAATIQKRRPTRKVGRAIHESHSLLVRAEKKTHPRASVKLVESVEALGNAIEKYQRQTLQEKLKQLLRNLAEALLHFYGKPYPQVSQEDLEALGELGLTPEAIADLPPEFRNIFIRYNPENDPELQQLKSQLEQLAPDDPQRDEILTQMEWLQKQREQAGDRLQRAAENLTSFVEAENIPLNWDLGKLLGGTVMTGTMLRSGLHALFSGRHTLFLAKATVTAGQKVKEAVQETAAAAGEISKFFGEKEEGTWTFKDLINLVKAILRSAKATLKTITASIETVRLGVEMGRTAIETFQSARTTYQIGRQVVPLMLEDLRKVRQARPPSPPRKEVSPLPPEPPLLDYKPDPPPSPNFELRLQEAL